MTNQVFVGTIRTTKSHEDGYKMHANGQVTLFRCIIMAALCNRGAIIFLPCIVRVSNPDMGVNLDPTDKVFFFADSGSPGGPN